MLRNRQPLVSFTFDDFPKSALEFGGRVLRKHGLRGTYYASLGLMGQMTPTGQIFSSQDLRRVVDEGHELGCHTFDHFDAWETRAAAFEESVIRNTRALHELLPGIVTRTLSYPMSPPRPHTKRSMQSRFVGCRGGGQTMNAGTMDLNNMRAFFLEQSRGDIDAVQRLIHANRRARGWLILATHDISEAPTPFGCASAFFEEIADRVARSGSRVLPVSEVLGELMLPAPPTQDARLGFAPG